MNRKTLSVTFGVAIMILVGIIIYFAVEKKSEPINNQSVAWNEYSNSYYSDYVINYPEYMKVSEGGQNNRRAIISTQDYDISMVNGKISSGFKVDVSVMGFKSLDNLFYCNKEELDISKDCLLAYTDLDYQKGEVKSESITLDGYYGIKYEFISNNGKNNNIGLVVKKDAEYYVVIIAYRTHKDMKLFNQILDSFKFK